MNFRRIYEATNSQRLSEMAFGPTKSAIEEFFTTKDLKSYGFKDFLSWKKDNYASPGSVDSNQHYFYPFAVYLFEQAKIDLTTQEDKIKKKFPGFLEDLNKYKSDPDQLETFETNLKLIKEGFGIKDYKGLVTPSTIKKGRGESVSRGSPRKEVYEFQSALDFLKGKLDTTDKDISKVETILKARFAAGKAANPTITNDKLASYLSREDQLQALQAKIDAEAKDIIEDF